MVDFSAHICFDCYPFELCRDFPRFTLQCTQPYSGGACHSSRYRLALVMIGSAGVLCYPVVHRITCVGSLKRVPCPQCPLPHTSY